MPVLDVSTHVKPGDMVTCPGCGQQHPLLTTDNGSEEIMVIDCGRHTFLMAMNNHLFLPEKKDYRYSFIVQATSASKAITLMNTVIAWAIANNCKIAEWNFEPVEENKEE